MVRSQWRHLSKSLDGLTPIFFFPPLLFPLRLCLFVSLTPFYLSLASLLFFTWPLSIPSTFSSFLRSPLLKRRAL